MKTLPIPVSKTDLIRIAKYLDDAAALYDTQRGQRNVCRAWAIRQITDKINRKINNHAASN